MGYEAPAMAPIVGYAFKVQFEGLKDSPVDTMFQEVGGLSRSLAVVTLQEGGENRFTHRLPGPAQYQNLSLKRGLLTDSSLTEWVHDGIERMVIRPLTVHVHLLRGDGPPEDQDALMSWQLTMAWPVKWSASGFNATSNGIAVESLELAFQTFSRS